MTPYIIRSKLTTTAIRNGYYNSYTGKIETNISLEDTYYLPQQNISTVFSYGSSQLKSNKQKINESNYTLFLPENYADIFNSKTVILTPRYDPELSNSSNRLVYSCACDTTNNCLGLSCFFIDINNLNDSSMFGISFNNPQTIANNSEAPLILNIKYNNNTIASVLYDSSHINNNVVIKHPSINLYEIALPNISKDIYI